MGKWRVLELGNTDKEREIRRRNGIEAKITDCNPSFSVGKSVVLIAAVEIPANNVLQAGRIVFFLTGTLPVRHNQMQPGEIHLLSCPVSFPWTLDSPPTMERILT